MTQAIHFFDLRKQNQLLKDELEIAMQAVIEQGHFIKGKQVTEFENQLATQLNVRHVIACGNGTDALQIALMALQLKPGDEVIVPAFTYIATIEVISLLGLVPVLADIEPSTFNISIESIKSIIGPKTKAIIPVHLFGQCANMQAIIEIANSNQLKVIEDAAQAIGSEYKLPSGATTFAGCMGDIGTTSFFPTKNLSCFGDGGALFTNNDELAKQIRMIANHGQQKQYEHEIIGINSRLDTIQAAVLQVKLKHLSSFQTNRIANATFYADQLKKTTGIVTPFQATDSTHVFNQYTVRIKNGNRDPLRNFLTNAGIASTIYYPKPVHQQVAYANTCMIRTSLENAEMACKEVLSLPIYPELSRDELNAVVTGIKEGLNQL